jgi:hypothetical protein
MAMKHVTRLLVVLVAAGAASGARAQVKVADSVANGEALFAGLDYGVSEQFDRAWLVLHYTFDAPCNGADGECTIDRPVQVHVPGLGYDEAAGQVVYRAEGADPVVCATVVRRGGTDKVKATGLCGTRLQAYRRTVDDGYAGRVERGQAILFGARPGRKVASR